MHLQGYDYCRIDGSTDGESRDSQVFTILTNMRTVTIDSRCVLRVGMHLFFRRILD